MTDNELTIFRAALQYLPFSGITIKQFAKAHNLNAQTLYNYICGQRPSGKHFRFIWYILEQYYPIAIEYGKRFSTKEKEA